MSESGRVEVLNAEVRVVQVGNGQMTRAMYRQLDEASLERFEPFGRVKDDKLKSGEERCSWWAATPRLERWSATMHNRLTGHQRWRNLLDLRWSVTTSYGPTGQGGKDPLNLHTGYCTPRNTLGPFIRLPTALTGAALSAPGGRSLTALTGTAGIPVRSNHNPGFVKSPRDLGACERALHRGPGRTGAGMARRGSGAAGKAA
jgi:hypothetical protein